MVKTLDYSKKIIITMYVFLYSGLTTGSSLNTEDIYTQVSTSLLSYDSVLIETVKMLESVDDLPSVDRVLVQVTHKHPEIEEMTRINSRGTIISKVIQNTPMARVYRNVGNQEWFRAQEILQKPYYGNIIQDTLFCLFWSHPVFADEGNTKKFAGVVSAKINLKSSFQSIENAYSWTFSITFQNQTVFPNFELEEKDQVITRPLVVYGLPRLMITYQPLKYPSLSALASSEDESLILEIEQTDRDSASGVQAISTETTHSDSMGRTSFLLFFSIVIISIIVILGSYHSITRAANRQKIVIEILMRGMM